MADHLSRGTNRNRKTVEQLQHELTEAKRRCLNIYTLYEESVKATEKFYLQCIQTETKLKIMIGLFLVSAMLNGLLIGICFHVTQQAPTKPPTIYIPEQMMPNIQQIA